MPEISIHSNESLPLVKTHSADTHLKATIKVHFRPAKNATLSSTLRVCGAIKPAKCHVKQNMLTKRYRCRCRHSHHQQQQQLHSQAKIYTTLWNFARMKWCIFSAVHCCAFTTHTHPLYPIWWSCVKLEVIHHFPYNGKSHWNPPPLPSARPIGALYIIPSLNYISHTHTNWWLRIDIVFHWTHPYNNTHRWWP